MWETDGWMQRRKVWLCCMVLTVESKTVQVLQCAVVGSLWESKLDGRRCQRLSTTGGNSKRIVDGLEKSLNGK